MKIYEAKENKECEICETVGRALEFYHDGFEYYVCQKCAVTNLDGWLEEKIKEWNYVTPEDEMVIAQWLKNIRVEEAISEYFEALISEAYKECETSGFVLYLKEIRDDIIKIIISEE